ncbi:hypothetical protein, conserved [Trypanosoma brucei gambiense DAL972]|uniref:Uncharacterized protein n=1 Tax=Trypanosoma brucei gambiense (strain MHOM/CI/86/DAL972) TaxID=679716 RepID=D0A741_TRYB9|nr:hypothetical protein, conserved [Trypanosoma brucei gambiense DAL972]CBH17492.1 hypothetical protein, conserved [Trypanosoma brucei gambiense DAL972]|eukprot:XP_011779756.1 hypothetical protein, conserved [Trypanosoma brucei gambiense DAL972]
MIENVTAVCCEQTVSASDKVEGMIPSSGAAADTDTCSVSNSALGGDNENRAKETVHFPRTPVRVVTPLQRRSPLGHLTPPATPLCRTPPLAVPCTPDGERLPPNHSKLLCPNDQDERFQTPTVKTPMLAADQESPVKHRHQRRKFLDNYFFLKNLNALPLTPERKKEREAGPFCRRALQFPSPNTSMHSVGMDAISSPLPPLSPSTPVTRPPQPSAEGSDVTEVQTAGRRFVRSFTTQSAEQSYTKSGDILSVPEGERCEGVQASVKEVCLVADASSRASSSLGEQNDKGRSPSPIGVDEEGEVTRPPHEVARTVTPCPLRSSEVGGKAEDFPPDAPIDAQEQGVQPLDNSGIAPIGVNDVSLHITSTASCQSGEQSTVCEGHDCPELGVLNTKCVTVGARTSLRTDGSKSGGRVEGLSLDQRKLLTEQPTRSRGGAVFPTEESLRGFSDKLFDQYQNKLAHLAFDVLYTRMVASPVTQMLESHGRRLICMRRDAWIRELIELERLLLPLVRGRSRSRGGNKNSARSKSSKRAESPRSDGSSKRSRSARCYIVPTVHDDKGYTRDYLGDGPSCKGFNKNVTQSVVIMDATDVVEEEEKPKAHTTAPDPILSSHHKVVNSGGCFPFVHRLSSRGGRRKERQSRGATTIPAE